MKCLRLDHLEGTFTGQTEYSDDAYDGKEFPLIYIHFSRSIDRAQVKLLADRELWISQGGGSLKQGKDKVKLSYGVYLHIQDGQEIILNIFEELLGEADGWAI